MIGTARSGTSLLYKALCLHPQAAYISNWVRRFPTLPHLSVLNRLGSRLSDAQTQAWFDGDGDAYVYGAHRSAWRRAFPQPAEGEPLYRRAGVPEAANSCEVDDADVRGVREAFNLITRYGGGRKLVSKRIGNNRRLPFLVAAFPEARFVEVIRDGRAVAYSLSQVDWWHDSPVWWGEGTPRQWEAKGGDPWELSARNWVKELEAIELGMECIPESQVLTITYEQFVARPLPTLREVAEFTGLGRDAAWERRLERIDFRNGNGAWRNHLGPREIRTIEAIQRDALRSRGYV